MDVDDSFEADRRADVRIRLPRRQLWAACHPQRRAGSGAIDALTRLLVGALILLASGCATPRGEEAGAPALSAVDGPITIQKQGSFAVGGKVLGDSAKSLHCDHGYVDYQIPVNPRRINLVMWHSAAATAWLNRWDGGEGYQSIFLRRGFPVYIWDGPHVGRANWGCTANTYEPGIGRDQQNFTAWRFGVEYPNWFEGVQFPTK